ncbi:hypothetical protein D3C75_837690 [compost metagenome]
MLEDLSTNKPKLIIFERDSDVWGHVYSSFAPELYTYINQHYTALNENDSIERNIYIRSEDYQKVIKDIWPGDPSLKEGDLISNQNKIYRIENGMKRYITNPEVFEKHGFKSEGIIQIDDETILKIRNGAPIDK